MLTGTIVFQKILRVWGLEAGSQRYSRLIAFGLPPVLERGELREMRRLQQNVLGTGRAAGVSLEQASDFLNPSGPVSGGPGRRPGS